jgi:antirestriction protein ArdC
MTTQTTTESTVSVSDALKTLDNGVANLIASDGWVSYLKTQAVFHHYSSNNVLWLLLQSAARSVAPTQFAGFQTWKKLGRSVRKGEKSFKVLAPCSYKRTVEKDNGETEERRGIAGFRVVSVFDLSQTDGEALPEIARPLSGDDGATEIFAQLAAWSDARGVSVTRGNTGSTFGYFSREARQIVVSNASSGRHALKTLVHEIAHSILHATDEGDSRETKEVEAESTAFVVLHALGLDSSDYSFGYIAAWSKGSKEIVRGVAARVQKTAHTILDALSKTPAADRLNKIEAALA